MTLGSHQVREGYNFDLVVTQAGPLIFTTLAGGLPEEGRKVDAKGSKEHEAERQISRRGSGQFEPPCVRTIK